MYTFEICVRAEPGRKTISGALKFQIYYYSILLKHYFTMVDDFMRRGQTCGVEEMRPERPRVELGFLGRASSPSPPATGCNSLQGVTQIFTRFSKGKNVH